MKYSSLPLLISLLFGFLIFLILRLHRNDHIDAKQRNWSLLLILILLSWGALSGYLSISGIYLSQEFLALSPGYWLPFVPVVLTLMLITLVKPLRDALRTLVDHSPRHWLSGIHLIRILALGTLFKASKGLFPEKFAWYVGIPDLLFGITAIVVTWLLVRSRLSNRFLIGWHLLGAMVILIPAISFMHLFMQEPLFPELLTFPMALAPSLVVPSLVMMNLLVVWRLLEKYR